MTYTDKEGDMSTDDIRFSVPAVWSVFYHELKGSPWEDEDIDGVVDRKNHDCVAAALALRYVYKLEWKGVDAEDGVLATLKAAREFYGGAFLTPGQVKEMARRFTACYASVNEPIQDHLTEYYDGMPLDWLSERGLRALEAHVRRDSEIWIDDENLPGVWVFTKPDRT